MQTRDHKLLGKYLLQQADLKLPFLYKMAFIAGNIEPDKNPFTYLHGMLRGKKFHGHNYENILPVMQKIYLSLRKQKYTGVLKYYHLGKLIHYTADAFTYPHNKTFTKGLREHCQYESKLHDLFPVILQKEKEKNQVMNRIKNFGELERIHEEYLQNTAGYLQDCKYILEVSAMLTEHILNGYSQSVSLHGSIPHNCFAVYQNGNKHVSASDI